MPAPRTRTSDPQLNIPLFAGTIPVIAPLLIKERLHDHYLELVQEIAKKGNTLLPLLNLNDVKSCLDVFVKDAQWNSFTALVFAIKNDSRLMGLVEPSMIKSCLASRKYAYCFSPLVQAIAPHPHLVKLVKVNRVQRAFEDLKKEMSYDRTNVPFRHRVDTNHLCSLAIAVKDNPALNVAIDPVCIGILAEALFKMGEYHARSTFQTDEHYPTEVPDTYTGFDPFIDFAKGLKGAPESWVRVASQKISDELGKTDDRFLPFIARAVNANPALMDEATFIASMANMDSSRMTSVLYAFKDTAHLTPAYRQAIPTLVEKEFKDWGQINLGGNHFGDMHRHTIVQAVSVQAEEMLRQSDYGSLSRFVGYPSIESDFLLSRGLAFTSILPHEIGINRSGVDSLCVFFRQTSGDALVCVEPQNDGYMQGNRPACMVTDPLKTADDIEKTPDGIRPTIKELFAWVAITRSDEAHPLPSWAVNIAREMLLETTPT